MRCDSMCVVVVALDSFVCGLSSLLTALDWSDCMDLIQIPISKSSNRERTLMNGWGCVENERLT